MPIKYWQRITYYNPIDPRARWHQSLANLLKWELHPAWRIFFWDIAENRRSFGTGVRVYNTESSAPVQFAQVMQYVFGQSLRFWGGVMDAVGEGNMTEKERKDQVKIFEQGLTKLDRFLFTALGYVYTRLPKDERQALASAKLEKEYTRRIYELTRKYEGDTLEEHLNDLDKWLNKCTYWIEYEMK